MAARVRSELRIGIHGDRVSDALQQIQVGEAVAVGAALLPQGRVCATQVSLEQGRLAGP